MGRGVGGQMEGGEAMEEEVEGKGEGERDGNLRGVESFDAGREWRQLPWKPRPASIESLREQGVNGGEPASYGEPAPEQFRLICTRNCAGKN